MQLYFQTVNVWRLGRSENVPNKCKTVKRNCIPIIRQHCFQKGTPIPWCPIICRVLALQTVIQASVFKDMLHKISSAMSQFPGLCRYFPRWGQGSCKASGIIRLRNALSLHKLIHSPHKHATREHLKQDTTSVTRSQSKPCDF